MEAVELIRQIDTKKLYLKEEKVKKTTLVVALTLGLVLSSCASFDTWLREGGGLFVEGLYNFEGSFVTLVGTADDGTYIGAAAITLDGVKIIGGRARLMVYGPEDTIFEGDATVNFDVIITEQASQETKTLGLGKTTAYLRAGSAMAIATMTVDLRPRK